ncbi:MAG: hypothetical protein ACI9CF_001095 [Candidatus Omnitrophota bacterium]|jgi:hypothetical protein
MSRFQSAKKVLATLMIFLFLIMESSFHMAFAESSRRNGSNQNIQEGSGWGNVSQMQHMNDLNSMAYGNFDEPVAHAASVDAPNIEDASVASAQIGPVQYSSIISNSNLQGLMNNSSAIDDNASLLATAPLIAPDDPGYFLQHWMPSIHAEEAWVVNRGEGAIVAVIGNGVDLEHPDLINNAWINDDVFAGGDDEDDNGYLNDRFGWNFADNNNNPFSPSSSHDTGAAGVIAAERDNGYLFAGVAPEAQIMALQVKNGATPTSTEQIIQNTGEAIRYAVDNGADVINFSFNINLGTDLTIEELRLGYENSALTPNELDNYKVYAKPIVDAIEYAYLNNVIVVASAGNGGATNDSTALSHNVFTGTREILVVGSIDADNTRSNFSDFGPELDYVMYGSNMPLLANDGGYRLGISGTSYAAPMLSGVLALMIAEDPFLSIPQMIAKLDYAASFTDLGEEGVDDEYGRGVVDARLALDVPDFPTATTPTLFGGIGQGASIQFTWDSSDRAIEYRFEIIDSEGSILVQESLDAGNTFYALPAGHELSGGTYSARVVSVDVFAQETVGELSAFDIPLDPPVFVPIDMDSMDATPTFSWNAIEGAVAYNLIVFSDEGSNIDVRLEGNDHTTYIVPDDLALASGQTYSVQVFAVSELGGIQGSEFQQISIHAEPENIVILSDNRVAIATGSQFGRYEIDFDDTDTIYVGEAADRRAVERDIDIETWLTLLQKGIRAAEASKAGAIPGGIQDQYLDGLLDKLNAVDLSGVEVIDEFQTYHRLTGSGTYLIEAESMGRLELRSFSGNIVFANQEFRIESVLLVKPRSRFHVLDNDFVLDAYKVDIRSAEFVAPKLLKVGLFIVRGNANFDHNEGTVEFNRSWGRIVRRPRFRWLNFHNLVVNISEPGSIMNIVAKVEVENSFTLLRGDLIFRWRSELIVPPDTEDNSASGSLSMQIVQNSFSDEDVDDDEDGEGFIVTTADAGATNASSFTLVSPQGMSGIYNFDVLSTIFSTINSIDRSDEAEVVATVHDDSSVIIEHIVDLIDLSSNIHQRVTEYAVNGDIIRDHVSIRLDSNSDTSMILDLAGDATQDTANYRAIAVGVLSQTLGDGFSQAEVDQQVRILANVGAMVGVGAGDERLEISNNDNGQPTQIKFYNAATFELEMTRTLSYVSFGGYVRYERVRTVDRAPNGRLMGTSLNISLKIGEYFDLNLRFEHKYDETGRLSFFGLNLSLRVGNYFYSFGYELRRNAQGHLVFGWV